MKHFVDMKIIMMNLFSLDNRRYVLHLYIYNVYARYNKNRSFS